METIPATEPTATPAPTIEGTPMKKKTRKKSPAKGTKAPAAPAPAQDTKPNVTTLGPTENVAPKAPKAKKVPGPGSLLFRTAKSLPEASAAALEAVRLGYRVRKQRAIHKCGHAFTIPPVEKVAFVKTSEKTRSGFYFKADMGVCGSCDVKLYGSIAYYAPSPVWFTRMIAQGKIPKALDGCEVAKLGKACPHGFPSWYDALEAKQV